MSTLQGDVLGKDGTDVDRVGKHGVDEDGIGVDGQAALDRGSSAPLHAQLKRVLLAQIHDGDFAAGDKLPTEMELVERYSVSTGVSKGSAGGRGSAGGA